MGSVSIPLYSRKYPGLFAIVDEADYEPISLYHWYVERPNAAKTFYAAAYIKSPEGKRICIRLHRLIMGAHTKDGRLFDHKNGNGLDCRKENLRLATHGQNMANRRKHAHSTNQYKGIQKADNKWRAVVHINGKAIRSVRYPTQEEAAHAYDALAVQCFGEFARTNFNYQVALL